MSKNIASAVERHRFSPVSMAEEGAMPFSSLSDPVDLALAQAALDAAWSEIRSTVPDADDEQVRTKLAYIVASLVAVAEDEHDLTLRAIERFRSPSLHESSQRRNSAAATSLWHGYRRLLPSDGGDGSLPR